MSRMCDQSGSSNNSTWNADFYHQYLQQHARLTEWILNLHQNLPQAWPNPLDIQNHVCHHHQHHVCCNNHHQNHVCHHNQHQPASQVLNHIPQQRHHNQHPRQPYTRRRNYRQNSCDSHHRIGSGNEYDAASVGDNENDVQEEDRENDVQEEDRENDVQEEDCENAVLEEDENDTTEEHDEDGEWVFNMEPFLAFRAENEKSKEEDVKSEASIVLVDAVLDENFEFIRLDDAGQMLKVCDRPTPLDAKDDFEYDKATRIVLYGDRADRIAGLETSLEIMFDHVNDLHEPVIYPVV